MEREKPKLKSINLMAPNPTVGTWQIWNLNPGPNNSNVDIIFKESQIEYSDGEESACNAGDPGSIPGLERSPGEGNGNPLQHSCLENFMDRGAWWAIVHGVTESRQD